jgi:hypothetical protein
MSSLDRSAALFERSPHRMHEPLVHCVRKLYPATTFWIAGRPSAARSRHEIAVKRSSDHSIGVGDDGKKLQLVSRTHRVDVGGSSTAHVEL